MEAPAVGWRWRVGNGWRRWAAAAVLIGTLVLAVTALAAPALAQEGELGRRVLQQGMWGRDVTELQLLLRSLGFDLEADGRYGPATVEAVKALQRALDLTVDGIVGPQTAQALLELRTPLVYTVKAGDSLWELERRFGTSMNELMDHNGLQDSALRVGQKLEVPGVIRVTVRRRLTVEDLAKRFDVSAATVAQLNQLKTTSSLEPGARVWVPLPERWEL